MKTIAVSPATMEARTGVTGTKFEEMLVVTDERAYYLDDDLPHQRRWSAARA